MPAVAVVGSLTHDVVDGGPPRPGGPPFHAARALRALGSPARIVTRCAPGDRRELLTPLAAFGLPVYWEAAERTASFVLRNRPGGRELEIAELGDPWTPEDVRVWLRRALGRVEWVHIGAVARSDFSAATLAALAPGRRLALDAQGLTRPARVGPVVQDGDFDRETLRHLAVLKLAEEEVEHVAGPLDPDALRALGVPEVVVTLGAEGCLVVTRALAERLPVRPVAARDPTGAGDAFLAAYVAGRAAGHSPVSAARRAMAVVAALLP
jgi:sugar/nucleoside kinase (ribokinase family)